jgi:MscS family membrane protein
MYNTQKYTLNNNIFKILLLLLLSVNLFSDSLFVGITEGHKQLQSQTKPILDDINNEVDPYDLGFIINIIHKDKSNLHTDNQIEKINAEMKKIVKNINDESIYIFDENDYENKIRFLGNKIDINSKYDNKLAVSRDIIKIKILENKKIFAQTINSIIEGKDSFKDKKYFIYLLNTSIEKLNKIDLKMYQNSASSVSGLTDSLSIDFRKFVYSLESQIKANLLVFNYLKENMNEYRASNLILDELSLKYVINKIDANSYIKNTSDIFYYYFHISVGKVVILISIFILFFIINTKILPFFTRLFSKRLSKKIKNLNISILDVLPGSFSFTLSLIIYAFALQVSLFLLIDTASRVNQLLPWFNTIYLALFSYMFYSILTNYINLSSDKIFNDYPNMRKEMVDFLLRILKILIFILLLLFLLVQLGFDIKAIIASLGIGGIAIALAAKDTLTNFFGSLNIITDNSFSQGDWIEAGNVEGTVVDIRMRTTRIRTFENAMITVPNAQLANMSILNWSKRVIGRRIKMSLGITYESKMSDIESLVDEIREMLQNHQLIATTKSNIDKKPYLLKKEDLIGVKNNILVYIDEYANSSINILVYCFSRSPNWEDWLETKQDVIVEISKLVEKNNCTFAFPTQTIHLEQNDSLLKK